MVFKFSEINKKLIEALVNAEVYFSDPPSLNDPFDCQIDIMKSLDQAIRKIPTSDIHYLNLLNDIKNQSSHFFWEVERDIKEYGVWSCSLSIENSLMWSHYADEHRGICLKYELPDKFIDHKLGEVIGVSNVTYAHNPLVNWFESELKNFDGKVFVTQLIFKLLTVKDKCWEYEEEKRVISRNYGTKIVGKSSLKEVCFGLRTSKSDKKLITEILHKLQYDVKICGIVRNENDFGLRVDEI